MKETAAMPVGGNWQNPYCKGGGRPAAQTSRRSGLVIAYRVSSLLEQFYRFSPIGSLPYTADSFRTLPNYTIGVRRGDHNSFSNPPSGNNLPTTHEQPANGVPFEQGREKPHPLGQRKSRLYAEANINYDTVM